ncbi:MAG: ApaG protein [Flavobacteriales bacterium]|jgi:ApaG protein
MVTAITKGIQISVQTQYRGCFKKGSSKRFVFSYDITIENHSDHPVQLLGRHWIISDSMHAQEHVKGEGIIGEKPVIMPGKSHSYQSGSHLRSTLGAMKGTYLMQRMYTDEKFHVRIPTFQLSAPFSLN